MPEVKASEGEDSQSNLLPGKMEQNFLKLKILLLKPFTALKWRQSRVKAAGAECVLTVLLDKMSVFEEESCGPRRKGLEGDSPRVGSADPGVPAASADSLQAGLEGQGWLSHFQENTELST